MRNLFLFTLLLLVACGNRNKPATETATTDPQSPRAEYPMPEVPSALTDPEQQAKWVSEHFWDKFPFTDNAALNDEQYTKTAWANFNMLLVNIPSEMGDSAIKILFDKASVNKEAFVIFGETAEEYLFDPNSPLRDEEYYITVLNTILASPMLDQYERIRPQSQLTMALKNRIGTQAADFTYTLANGKTGTLYGLRAPYTLVFFNNPGCPACAITIEAMVGSQVLTDMIAAGKVKILALYPDEDLTAWREHAKDFPTTWINSHDASMKIKNEEMYDLKAIPTIYLLDANKKVLLKDVTNIQLIEQTLTNDNN